MKTTKKRVTKKRDWSVTTRDPKREWDTIIKLRANLQWDYSKTIPIYSCLDLLVAQIVFLNSKAILNGLPKAWPNYTVRYLQEIYFTSHVSSLLKEKGRNKIPQCKCNLKGKRSGMTWMRLTPIGSCISMLSSHLVKCWSTLGAGVALFGVGVSLP